jgi:hypothetical protein
MQRHIVSIGQKRKHNLVVKIIQMICLNVAWFEASLAHFSNASKVAHRPPDCCGLLVAVTS